MNLSKQLLQLHETKSSAVVPAKKSFEHVSEQFQMETEYKMFFDMSAMADYKMTEDMDLTAWVDDVIDKAKVEKSLDTKVMNELKKQSWFNEKFESVTVDVDSVDFNGKLSGLSNVALNLKLTFTIDASISSLFLTPALENIVPELNGDMKFQASLLDAERYK